MFMALVTGQWVFICLVITVLVSACGSPGLAPVITKEIGGEREPVRAEAAPKALFAARPRPVPGPVYHITVPGDTLYSIAWRYGKDYRDLARWNGILEPYTIYPGQRLHLRQPLFKQSSINRAVAPLKALDKPVEPKPPQAQVVPVPKLKNKADKDPTDRDPVVLTMPIQWEWPADGRLLQSNTRLAKHGLEIFGQEGQLVKAAAPGKVVYSGDGLLGYGKLIIIKHGDIYLSAYAHNRKLLVTEGEQVSRGQPIAEMGSTGTNQVKLYFEIRRNGRPVPPLEYLPKRNI